MLPNSSDSILISHFFSDTTACASDQDDRISCKKLRILTIKEREATFELRIFEMVQVKKTVSHFIKFLLEILKVIIFIEFLTSLSRLNE